MSWWSSWSSWRGHRPSTRRRIRSGAPARAGVRRRDGAIGSSGQTAGGASRTVATHASAAGPDRGVGGGARLRGAAAGGDVGGRLGPVGPIAAPPAPDDAVTERFIDAWERSRLATFVASGTYERQSVVTDASIASEDVVAQRPPRRLHRQLGGVEGRDDDRLLVCPAPPAGEEEDVAALPPRSAGWSQLCRVRGQRGVGPAVDHAGIDSALRRHRRGARLLRAGPHPFDPRAPFGIEASFCFDAATGAPAGSRVRHAGGIEEVVVVTDIRTTVTDADLRALSRGIGAERGDGGLRHVHRRLRAGCDAVGGSRNPRPVPVA